MCRRRDYSVRGTRLGWRSPMSAKAEDLLRQQYLVPRKSVKKLREMSRRQGVSAGELARRAIEIGRASCRERAWIVGGGGGFERQRAGGCRRTTARPCPNPDQPPT